MKKPVGIIIISFHFFSDGVFYLYQCYGALWSGDFTSHVISLLLISLYGLISGIGLFLKRGWGRNTALIYNSFLLIVGVATICTSFVYDKSNYFVDGLVEVIIAMLIFMYLLKKSVKEKFTENPKYIPVTYDKVLLFFVLFLQIAPDNSAFIVYFMCLVGVALLFKQIGNIRVMSYNS